LRGEVAALRDAHNAGILDAATLVAEAERLSAQLDKLVGGATRYPPNRRLQVPVPTVADLAIPGVLTGTHALRAPSRTVDPRWRGPCAISDAPEPALTRTRTATRTDTSAPQNDLFASIGSSGREPA
jgi:hypothetical protein